MTSGDIAIRVRKIIAEQLCVTDADVKPESTLEDLGADSLDIVELILALEDEFLIEISDGDGEGLKTVQQAIDYIGRRCPG